MPAPQMTFGNVLHTSASLAAGANTADNLDASNLFEAQVIYKVTGGSAVATTYGLLIQPFPLYSGTTYTDSATGTLDPQTQYTVTGYTASQVAYSIKIFVPTGRWSFKITNLDATNAITVEALADYVFGVA